MMNINLPDGIPTCFAELDPGTCFMFWRDARIFGLCVTHAGRKMALAFQKNERNQAVPWLASGGFPNDTVVSYPTARLRAEWSDISDPDNDRKIGSIIVTARGYYIRAQERMAGTHTFNLQTGEMESPDQGIPFASYPKWKVGIIVDDNFVPIFEFPAHTEPSS